MKASQNNAVSGKGVKSSFLVVEQGSLIYLSHIPEYAEVLDISEEEGVLITDLGNINAQQLKHLFVVSPSAMDNSGVIIPGSLMINKNTGDIYVVEKDTDEGIYTEDEMFIPIKALGDFFVSDQETINDCLEIVGSLNNRKEYSTEADNVALSVSKKDDAEVPYSPKEEDLHYNGWKTLEDHIALYGALSGYQAIMFVVRKYQDRAHLKGQFHEDFRKIRKYLDKAEEIVRKYGLAKNFHQ